MQERTRTFKFRHPVEVRFKDIDLGGHAHHSHALVYFEEARWAYWKTVLGHADPARIDYILAEATVRYHQRVFWPLRLDVGVRVSLLGKKHFEMEYEASGSDGSRLVSGRTVQVWYDYATARSARIPDAARQQIEQWESELLSQ